MKKIKLFAFPYAGGLSSAFVKWSKYLDKSIEFHPIEYAGRGTRFNDPPFENLNDIVKDVYERIKDDINGAQFAFFGHSMGSIVAYELSHMLLGRDGTSPEHIFFSGHGAPEIKRNNKIHHLPDDEFKKELSELGGTKEELLENKELFEIFLPALRADFKAIEDYEYIDKDKKLNCDVTILNGKADDIAIHDITKWKLYTEGKCNFYMFNGGHFFIHDEIENIARIINHTFIG